MERVLRSCRAGLEGLESVRGVEGVRVVRIVRRVLEGLLEEGEGWVVLERGVCERERERLNVLVEEVGAVPEMGGAWRRV